MVTLTTDPARFDSLADAAASLMADVNRLRSWLATPARLGHRPSCLAVWVPDADVPAWIDPEADLPVGWRA